MRIAATLALGITACMVGDAPPEPLEASADEPLPAELRAGDIVFRGEAEVTVPEPGGTAGISVERDDGTQDELVVENPLDAPVRLATQPLPPVAIETHTVSTACGDGAYHLEGFHWNKDYHWFFQADSTPSANVVANVITGLRTAANAITTQRNDCGFHDLISATNSYGGTTKKAPNIPASATKVSCGSPDGTNTVGFGVLPKTYLAVTCYWTSNKIAVEADVRISTKHAWFAEGVPSGCSNKWGIEQVMTHEFGHVFGLAHVSQANHPTQTMSVASYPCTNAHLSLGLGDIRGLRALY